MGHFNSHTFVVASAAPAAFVEDWTSELAETTLIVLVSDFWLNSAACLLDRTIDHLSLPLVLWPIFSLALLVVQKLSFCSRTASF